jgi:iron complex outermembrane receptor protein
MKKLLSILLLLMIGTMVQAQQANYFSVVVSNEKGQPIESAAIQLFNINKKLVKTALTDSLGKAFFQQVGQGEYYLVISSTGYATYTSQPFVLPLANNELPTMQLKQLDGNIQGVTVAARKPFIQRSQGKTIVNVDASITNAGTTVLEVLEKSPGIMVDKNGGISMQGKTGVLIMIDDKPTYLSGTDLSNMLGGMSSSQVEQIELITNPSAKYDASGNAGIINIKTKKNKQQGFNGILTFAYSQGKYPKANNSIVLNYRKNKFNSFLTYSNGYNEGFTSIYALRDYFNNSGTVTSTLEQPTYLTSTNKSNTIKTGLDYYASSKTTVGLSLTGIAVSRKGANDASAIWKDATGHIDSTIATTNTSKYKLKNAAANIYFRHSINKKQDLGIDIDWLGYDIKNEQYFNNKLLATGGYNEASNGNIPSTLKIATAKLDYTLRFAKEGKLEAGAKTAYTKTDNTAAYQFYDGTVWKDDLGKSNHFLYNEHIHALYTSVEQKLNKVSMQFGLRYEYTDYKVKQLGNSIVKDSAFSNNYDGLFPSGFISWEADSSNTFSFTASRRIDRPAFQKLNPFTFIINKYTFQTGNPFFLPQDSWNMEVGHQYKQLLTTTVSYSIIKNYFSQLFLTNADGILIYSEGNVGRMHNFGASVSIQSSFAKWWSFTGTALYNYKKLDGFVWNSYSSSISQMNFSMNNQFRIGKSVNAELSGFYTTRARNDLQELLYPTGQLSAGVSTSVFKKKATLKLGVRDMFFTQVMEGVTDFQHASEYFILRRDSRVVNLSLVYRFGKQYKQVKRSSGGAGDEMQRAGS